MGACRHGDKCDRRHNRPTESPTVLFTNMYQSPPNRFVAYGDNMYNGEELKVLDEFYEDVFVELSKYGEIEDLNICANPGQHLNGNVYVKFRLESQAANVIQNTMGRLYDGHLLKAELSPVTDFGEARCRQYAAGECDRKMCNFMHLREPNRRLRRQLFKWQAENRRKQQQNSRQSPPTRRHHNTSPIRPISPIYSPISPIPHDHHRVDPFGRDVEPNRGDASEEEQRLRRQLIEVQQARRHHEDQERHRKRDRVTDPSDQMVELSASVSSKCPRIGNGGE